jgi:IS30 family transposase
LGIYEKGTQGDYIFPIERGTRKIRGLYSKKNDIAIISRKINRQPKTVRRHIEKLRDKDASFSNFTYIGKPSVIPT